MKWRQQNFFNAHLQASGPKYSPLYFNTEKVADNALRTSWFWQTSGGFPGTWGIFSSPLDAKLGADGLVLQWNGHSKAFRTLTFELVGRNIAILHFKTEPVAETTFRASWFWSTSARFPGTCEIISSPGDSKLTRAGLGLQWDENRKSFWTHTFSFWTEIEPHFEIALRASWFWATSARFEGTKGIYSSSEDSNSWWPWFAVKWTQQNFLNAQFRASAPKYSPPLL